MNKKPRYPHNAFGSSEAAYKFADEQCLQPWEQVAEQWNQLSGESLTRSRVMQIARVAHEKLRQKLVGIEF
jgi:hypothetical protein